MVSANAKRSKRTVYVVITEGRVFTFGSWKTAQTFFRRARRLPSMQGRTLEFVSTRLVIGSRRFAAPVSPPEWPTITCGGVIDAEAA